MSTHAETIDKLQTELSRHELMAERSAELCDTTSFSEDVAVIQMLEFDLGYACALAPYHDGYEDRPFSELPIREA